MSFIFTVFLFTLNAFSNSPLEGCGTYSFTGTVTSEKHLSVIILNKDTYSAQKIILNSDDSRSVSPFDEKIVKGKIQITSIDGTTFKGSHPTDLDFVSLNYFRPSESALTLIEKNNCEAQK